MPNPIEPTPIHLEFDYIWKNWLDNLRTFAEQKAATTGDVEIEDEGGSLTTAVTKMNFVGAGVTVTEPIADEVLVTISGSPAGNDIEVRDEGSLLTNAAIKFDFAGAGVSVTEPVTDELLVTIPGIGSIDLDDVNDVDTTTTTPQVGDPLVFDGTNWVPDLTQLIREVDDVSGTTIYVGEAVAGTATSASSWRVSRTVFTGDDSAKRFANGAVTFTNVWDDHLTDPYS